MRLQRYEISLIYYKKNESGSDKIIFLELHFIANDSLRPEKTVIKAADVCLYVLR